MKQSLSIVTFHDMEIRGEEGNLFDEADNATAELARILFANLYREQSEELYHLLGDLRHGAARHSRITEEEDS